MNRVATSLTLLATALALGACSDIPYNATTASLSSSAYTVAGPASASTNPAANPNVPGATGRTIVIGSNSTIAGDAEATRLQQLGLR